MKYLKNTLFIFLTISLFISCTTTDENGTVLVTVKYHDKAVDQATIYMKSNTLVNPNIPLKQYDQVKSADASGQAYFSNLQPTNYFFFARGYSSDANGYVQAEAAITIESQQYSYLTINAN